MNPSESRVRKVLQENGSLHISISKISSDDQLKDFGINSIRYMSIIIDLQREFGIEYKLEDISIDNFSSINKIVDTLKKYIN